MAEYKNCVNCGKQNLVDAPTDRCFSCGKPVGIKQSEVTPVHQVEKVDAEKPPAPEIYVASGENRQIKRRGLYKWRKRCKNCEFHYVHDEIIWCSSEKCPQRCPPRLRPQYRPKIEFYRPGKEATRTQKLPETPEEAEEVCANCPVVQLFKGYRLAFNDILASARKRKGG